MNNQLLVALGFFGLGMLTTILTAIRIKRRDMSTSGIFITPKAEPGQYRIELIMRVLGCLVFYGVAVFAGLKYLNQK